MIKVAKSWSLDMGAKDPPEYMKFCMSLFVYNHSIYFGVWHAKALGRESGEIGTVEQLKAR